MKKLIYILLFIFSIQIQGQTQTLAKGFKIELHTIEKTTRDTIRNSIIEVYSGKKRISTDVSDFDGISIFFIKSKDIIKDKIFLKIHGPQCKVFKKRLKIKNDLNIQIDLQYGKTKYTHPNQLHKMQKELNIKPKFLESKCGFTNNAFFKNINRI